MKFSRLYSEETSIHACCKDGKFIPILHPVFIVVCKSLLTVHFNFLNNKLREKQQHNNQQLTSNEELP